MIIHYNVMDALSLTEGLERSNHFYMLIKWTAAVVYVGNRACETNNTGFSD